MGGLGIMIALLFTAVPVMIVVGGIWLSATALYYLGWGGHCICALYSSLSAASLFRATRPASAIGFVVSSYIFGASAWFAGLLTSYIYYGTVWTVRQRKNSPSNWRLPVAWNTA